VKPGVGIFQTKLQLNRACLTGGLDFLFCHLRSTRSSAHLYGVIYELDFAVGPVGCFA